MAAVTARRTMGQSGQRTLHPFFGKCFNNDKVGDTTSGNLTPQETEQRKSPHTPLSASDISVAANTDSTALDNLNDCDGRGPLTGPGSNQQALGSVDTDEEQHLKRRKRRKTDDHNVFESESSACHPQLQSPVTNSLSISTPSKTPDSEVTKVDRGTEAQTAQDLSCAVSTSETPTTPPKRRTLRLNPNGKLLSSPSDCPEDDHRTTSGAKKKSRSKKKGTQKDARLSLVVSWKYGVHEESRERIGCLINDIFHGLRRHSPSISRRVQQDRPDGPLKPIHPFFLGKSKQKKASGSEQEHQSPASVVGFRQSTLPPSTTTSSYPLKNVTAIPKMLFQPAHTPSRKSSEAFEPIWPPRGLLHVRGPMTTAECNPLSQTKARYHEKKAKGSVLYIPPSESVLSLEYYDVKADIRDRILRQPKQVILRGNKLQEVTLAKLRTITGDGARPLPANGARKSKTLHPALGRLISSLPTAQSSFDKAGYDDIQWIQKYAPKCAEDVLQLGHDALKLRTWLQSHEVSSVNTGETKPPKKPRAEEEAKRKKKRKKPKDLDGFIVSSSEEEAEMVELSGPEDEGDEDELAGGVTIPHRKSVMRAVGLPGEHRRTGSKGRVANAVIISGPSGCGKTATVYAVSKELGFEVFELNAGSRRSARDIIERVGDMTQNHLVQLLDEIDKGGSLKSTAFAPDASEGQSTMNSFFKRKATSTIPRKDAGVTLKVKGEDSLKPARNQKQSLILLEEVDILFEEDKQFWSGVLALISQSKRPIVMTCNDETLLPLAEIPHHAHFRFRPPPLDLAVDYMLLVAANEGHVLERQPLSELYTVLERDLRATIMQLNFWCQMAVGSKKSGLDWLINRPRISTESPDGDSHRAVSSDTYTHGMGWYGQDTAASEPDSLKRKSRLLMDCLEQWNIGLSDWHEDKESQAFPKLFSRLDALIHASDIADVKSDLDLMCQESPHDVRKDALDVSAPRIPEKQRSNYTEGHHFLQADFKLDYTNLNAEISVCLSVLLEDCLEAASSLDDGHSITNHVLGLRDFRARQRRSLSQSEYRKAFEPLTELPEYYPSSLSGRSLSLEEAVGVLARDVAPFVRSIVSFDLRLERRRLELSGLISHGSKRIRTTRASRAALEGGDKATTRRERWFPVKLNPPQILATAGRNWQDLLLDLEDAGRPATSASGTPAEQSAACDSDSDGGI
ncbi:hypothetical protein VTO42DRAFT_3137 [Malbranchea cinnamomea]